MMKNLYDTSNVFRLDKNVVVVFIFSSCIVNQWYFVIPAQ